MSEKVIRPTIQELWRGIQEASRKFPVGTEWQHYNGDVYEITGHGVDEATGKPEVRYVKSLPLGDNRPKLRSPKNGDFPRDFAREVEFHRPLAMMEGNAAWPVHSGDTIVRFEQHPRFRRLYRCEHYERV
jgi:hypothetical protein